MIEITDENSNCIIKAFENNPIAILQESDDNNKKIYWFKAADIGKALKLSNIRVSIQNFDEDEKGVRKAYTIQGEQDTLYLSSQGVYRVLYNSKKEIAKKFRKWVGVILDDLIFNQGKELKIQLDKYHLLLEEKDKLLEQKTLENIKDKETILLKSYDKKSVVYLILINGILYKFGYSNDIKERFKTHKKEINENITLIYCIESKNNILLEQNLKCYLQNTNYRKTQSFNDKNQTELIEINDITIIENRLEKLNKIINEDKEILEYKMKILELENENIKLKIKQLTFVDEIKIEIKQETKTESQDNIKTKSQEEIKTELQHEIQDKTKQERRKEYYEKNKTRLLQQKKEYYEKNKPEFLRQKKEYYEKNKDKNRELKNKKVREYKKNNKDLIKQKNKEYKENNKDLIKQKNKEYREKIKQSCE